MSAPRHDDILQRSGLRAAADGIPENYPDAVLLRAVKAATISRDNRDDAYANWNARPSRRTGTRAEAHAVFWKLAEEHRRLEDEIIHMRATTAEGAVAKLQYILKSEEFDIDDDGRIPGGTKMSMPLSAMRDALRMLGG